MQCMVFVCVIWSFDEMGLREQVILSDKGNRETEQIMLFYFKTWATMSTDMEEHGISLMCTMNFRNL